MMKAVIIAGFLCQTRAFRAPAVLGGSAFVRRFSEQRAGWQEDSKPDGHRVYLKIPFADKEQAKALGAKWDSQRKCWYAFPEDEDVLSIWPPVPAPQAAGSDESSENRAYLNVAYEQKDEARADGARWDAQKKKWYAPNGEEHLLSKYGSADSSNPSSSSPSAASAADNADDERFYINVPFEERAEAKAQGAKWDKERKKWYTTDLNSPVLLRWPIA